MSIVSKTPKFGNLIGLKNSDKSKNAGVKSSANTNKNGTRLLLYLLMTLATERYLNENKKKNS